MKRKPLTPAEQDRVVEMREGGATISKIATALGCSCGSVRYWCLVHAAVPPKGLKKHTAGGSMVRNGRVVRPFSPEEDQEIMRLRGEGLSLAEIGRRVGRAHNSILMRLMSISVREELAA